jgi:hypothetical protein
MFRDHSTSQRPPRHPSCPSCGGTDLTRRTSVHTITVGGHAEETEVWDCRCLDCGCAFETGPSVPCYQIDGPTAAPDFTLRVTEVAINAHGDLEVSFSGAEGDEFARLVSILAERERRTGCRQTLQLYDDAGNAVNISCGSEDAFADDN